MSKHNKNELPAEALAPSDERAERPSASGILVFIVTLAITLAVLGVLLYCFWPMIGGTLTEEQSSSSTTTEPAVTQPTTLYSYGDRVSFAVYITDDNDRLQSTSLLMIQPDLKEFSVLGLPPQLAVTETDSLFTLFRNGRAEACQLSLMSYFGKSIDYYVVLSYSDVQALFKELNDPLIYTLTTDIDEQTANGDYAIHLKAGELALTPTQVAKLLQYNNWQNGITERSEVHADLVLKYLTQYLNPSRSLDEDYNTLLTNAECNLTGERFRVILPMLEYLSKEKDTLRTIVHYTEGTFKGAGEAMRFYPGSQSIDIAKASLR